MAGIAYVVPAIRLRWGRLLGAALAVPLSPIPFVFPWAASALIREYRGGFYSAHRNEKTKT